MSLEDIPPPLAVIGFDGGIRGRNRQFTELMGLSAMELENRSLPDLAEAKWGLGERIRSELERLERKAGEAFFLSAEVHAGKERERDRLFVRGKVREEHDGSQHVLISFEQVFPRDASGGHSPQNFARALFNSVELDRSRIARELHNNISQRLARLEMDISDSDARAPDRLRSELSALSRDLGEISNELYPVILEDLGLTPALQSLAGKFQYGPGKIASIFERDLPAEIPPRIGLGLYRITQDALRRAAEHKTQGPIEVGITGGNNRVRLRIAGLAATSLRPSSEAIGIEERARALDADLKVGSTSNGGAWIEVDVPLSR